MDPHLSVNRKVFHWPGRKYSPVNACQNLNVDPV